MNAVDKGLDFSIALIKWFLNVFGGIIGFLLPFITLFFLAAAVSLLYDEHKERNKK